MARQVGSLQLVEDDDERLVLSMSALPMIGHMSLLTFIAVVVTAALTMFTRRWIGIFLSCVFIVMPGTLCAICGIWGCLNARSFTFTFDRTRSEFIVVAGTAQLSVPLSQILLVYIERECDAGGGMFNGNSAPTFSATLLLVDGQRCHLEGGVAVTGSGMGPPDLHASCLKINEFLRLPQTRLPILELTKAAKPEPDTNDSQSQERMSRWISCAGISPKLEPPLHEYPWLEAPEGVILPRSAARPIGRSSSQVGGYPAPGQTQVNPNGMHSPMPMTASRDCWDRSFRQVGAQQANGSVVVGRVAGQPQPRFLEVVVPEGTQGQSLTVMTPDGVQLAITVPPDAQSGQPITLQY